jgi:putative redox protein
VVFLFLAMTSKVIYNGELRTTAVHLASNNSIITDAPTDNHGKGEAFSPTDLVATAFASCMLTVMGIKANQMNLDIADTRAEVTKIMASEPRRISEIAVTVYMPKKQYSDKEKTIMEHTAETCPVFFSLHTDLKKSVIFVW